MRFECVCAKLLQLHLILCDPMDRSPTRLLCPWGSPGNNTREGSRSLLQGIFPTKGSKQNAKLLGVPKINLR